MGLQGFGFSNLRSLLHVCFAPPYLFEQATISSVLEGETYIQQGPRYEEQEMLEGTGQDKCKV